MRTISQAVGYTLREKREILIPTLSQIQAAFVRLGLNTSQIIERGELTEFGRKLFDYYQYRADVLNRNVRPNLMRKEEAETLFYELQGKLRPKCAIPKNKQKGKKSGPAFLTGIINMIIEANIGDLSCTFDPRELTTVTMNGLPLRTLARRVDGAFPSTVNPIAIWEIKEYCNTTTFGSRVADGVYETLLDGMELEELRASEKVDIKHYLFLDDHFTWWECGRSYLCRVIDLLNMGYVHEVFFGRETVEALPSVVRAWVNEYAARSAV